MTSIQSSSNPFFWGVATSGYQSEGGYNEVGMPQNNWSRAEQRGTVAKTGKASEFWSRYTEDFETCKKLGLNAFRMSLEWARIQPSFDESSVINPAFDEQVLDAYADRIAACQSWGLEPIVTLQHFTHPLWLGVDAWLQPNTIAAYQRYVETAVTHINRRLVTVHQSSPIRWFITVNEPNILVINTYLNGSFPSEAGISLDKALTAFDHLLAAHIKAYESLHRLYAAEGWNAPQVSLNTYCSDLYWSEKFVWDLLSLAGSPPNSDSFSRHFRDRAQQFEETLKRVDLPFQRNLSYYIGSGLRKLVFLFGAKAANAKKFQATLTALREIKSDRVFDFIAIDYYDPFLAHSFRFPSFSDLEFGHTDFRGWLMNSMQTKWWDWRSLPEGLHFFCQYYCQEYAPFPLLIAENGMAIRRTQDNHISSKRSDLLQRSEFIRKHVEQVQRLRQEAVPLIGYLHWSLTDNYEWGSYTPRFGLFSIDYQEGSARSEIDHLGDRPAKTYSALIQTDRQSTVR